MSGKDGILDKLDNNLVNKIKDLFKKIKKNDEFEFIFFSRGDKNLSYEKYINLLKFLSRRESMDKKFRLVNNVSLDVAYNPDREISYRCTIETKDTIDKYMKKLSTINNHAVFNNLMLLIAKNKYKNLSVIKKAKNYDETIDVDDLYMRVRKSEELSLTQSEMAKLSSLSEREMNKIIFRFKERTSLYVLDEKDKYVRIDLTITKMSRHYESLNRAIPRYELEVEAVTGNMDTKMLD